MLPKLSELKNIALQINPAVISLSETWLDESVTDNEIHIDGYSILRKDRNREGGGVCNYIRNDVAFVTRQDLSTDDDFEFMWIELLLPKTKPILVGTCYRPPKQRSFLDFFANTLSKIDPSSEIIILGDFNICTK